MDLAQEQRRFARFTPGRRVRGRGDGETQADAAHKTAPTDESSPAAKVLVASRPEQVTTDPTGAGVATAAESSTAEQQRLQAAPQPPSAAPPPPPPSLQDIATELGVVDIAAAARALDATTLSAIRVAAGGDASAEVAITQATVAKRERALVHAAYAQQRRRAALQQVALDRMQALQAVAGSTAAASSSSPLSPLPAAEVAQVLMAHATAQAVAQAQGGRSRVQDAHALASPSPVPVSPAAAKLEVALLQASYALAAAAGGPVGPADGGALTAVAEAAGIDLSALRARMTAAAATRRSRAGGSAVASEAEEAAVAVEEEEEEELWGAGSSGGEAQAEAQAAAAFAGSEATNPLHGIALPDSLFHPSMRSRAPRDRIASDQPRLDRATGTIIAPQLPPEIAARQAALAAARARSELAHAQALIMKALTAASAERAGLTLPSRDDKAEKEEEEGDRLQLAAGPGKALATRDTAVALRSKGASDTALAAAGDGDSRLTTTEAEEEALRDLSRALGYPLRDARTGRALVQRHEVVAAIQAYRKKMKQGGEVALAAHLKARREVVAAAMNAKDEAEMVRILLQDVEAEDAARGEGEDDDEGALQVAAAAPGTPATALAVSGDHPAALSISAAQSQQSQSQQYRTSLVPLGYKDWSQVADAHASSAKRRKAASAALRAQQQQTLDATIRPARPNGETQPPSPRQVRAAANIQRVLSDILTARHCDDPALYPGGLPVEIVEVDITPDLRKAYIRWTCAGLPMTYDEAQAAVAAAQREGVQGMGTTRNSRTAAALAEWTAEVTAAAAASPQPAAAAARAGAGAAAALAAELMQKRIAREEAAARAKRKPKRQDKYGDADAVAAAAVWGAGGADATGAATGAARTPLAVVASQAEKALVRNAGLIKRLLGAKLGLRFIPALEFHRYVPRPPTAAAPAAPAAEAGVDAAQSAAEDGTSSARGTGEKVSRPVRFEFEEDASAGRGWKSSDKAAARRMM